MKRNALLPVALVATMALAACSDSTSTSLVSDAEVTADVASTAGDAIAEEVAIMLSNEGSVGPAVPAAPSFNLFSPPTPGLNITRTRTCYDAQQVAQSQCDAQTTASIEFTLSIDGGFTRTHTGPRGTETVTVVVDRDRLHTISGLAGTETSRQHDGHGASHDVTTFSGTHEEVTVTREYDETSTDSVQAIVFNLPHQTNPWPASGRIVRNVAGTMTVSQGDREESRSFSRRITVTFPADSQGNVTITINNTTCTLNLFNRTITNCSNT